MTLPRPRAPPLRGIRLFHLQGPTELVHPVPTPLAASVVSPEGESIPRSRDRRSNGDGAVMDANEREGPDDGPDVGFVPRVVEVVSFPALLKAATPRVVVTYVIAAACLAVYAAMVLTGVSPFQP